MDLKEMNTCEVIAFLATSGVPKEICDLLEENLIDGSTLLSLTEDTEEFMAVLPKAGHRLRIKKIIRENKGHEASKLTKEVQDKSLGLKIALHETDSCDTQHFEVNLTPVSSTSSTIIVVDQPLSSTSKSNTTIPVESYESSAVNPNPDSDNDILMTLTSANKGNTETPIKSEQSANKKWNDRSSILPEILPFPSNFSSRVEAAIKQGSVLPVRRHLISEIGSFFYGMTSHPQQGEFKRIALDICKKFPELMDSNPSKYWLSVQKQLSQYFRNQRRYSVKALSAQKEGNETASQNTAKRLKIFVDDPEAQKRNLLLLKDAKAVKAMSKDTSSSLIESTFRERQNFIKTASSSAEVLEMCPYLGKRENLRDEMCRILKKDSVKQADKRLQTAFKSVLGKEDLTPEEILNAVGIVGKRTARKKATSLIKFKDPSAKVDSLFRDKIVQFRILCVGCPDDIQQIFITGEDQPFVECPDQDIVKALVDLISSYWVFDVSYPDCMVGILTFLQEIGLEFTDNSYKGTKYSAFMSELKNKIDICK